MKTGKNQQRGTKKLAIHRETLRALEAGKLVVAADDSHCPTACSVC